MTEGNGKYVLLVYGLLLGVLLPYYVGKWWYGTQRLTKEKVLIASAGNLFKEYKDDMVEGDVVSALSCGEEFKDVLRGNKVDTGLEKVERAIADIMTNKDRQKLQGYEGPRRKALALLWAYLGRIRLDGSTLDDGGYTQIFVTYTGLHITREIRNRSHCPLPKRSLHRRVPRLC